MAGGAHTMSLAWDQQNGRGNVFGVSVSKPLPLSLFGEAEEEEEEGQVEEGAAQVHANGRKDDEEEEFGEFECVGMERSENGEGRDVDIVGFASFGNGGTDLNGFGNLGKGDIVDLKLDGFGNFDKGDRVGSDADTEVNGSSSSSQGVEEENGWRFHTSTSEWMLAMHGIRGVARLGAEEVSFPSQTNGDVPSLTIQKLAPPDPADDDDDDEWGEFAGPLVIKKPEPDMIDLISMLEEVPGKQPSIIDQETEEAPAAEQISLSSIADVETDLFNSNNRVADGQDSGVYSGVFDLLSTSDMREVSKPDGSEGLFGFQFEGDASSKDITNATSAVAQPIDFDLLLSFEQPAGVSGNETTQEDLFVFDMDASQTTSQTVADKSSVTAFENGFVDANWGADFPHAKADGLSRSVSLPVSDAKPASHQRTHSNGNFTANLLLIEEWSLEPSVSSLFEGTGNHDEKKTTELNIMESLLDIDVVKDEKPKSNGFTDLLDLDWDYKNSAVSEVGSPVAADTKADSATNEQPQWYLGKWAELSSVCAYELEQGAGIWNEATSGQCESELVSVLQGEKYFKALLQIYRVYLILRATLHHHSSWLEASTDHTAKIKLCMDRSRQAWVCLKDMPKYLGLQEPVYPETIVSLETPACALTLVSLQSMPDVPSTMWDGRSYFLPVANLWANRISHRPPFDV